MRNELQEAIEYFETYSKEYKPVSNSVPKYILDDLNEQTQLYRTALTALRDMMRRREGCAMCRGIVRAEKIDMILAYKADGGIAGLSEISCNYCPRCGRELSGNAEQVKEGEG